VGACAGDRPLNVVCPQKERNNVQKSIEVKVPVRTAYNQWTQFEGFPHFMEGVKQVAQLDDTHLHWKAEIAGKEKEGEAETPADAGPAHCLG
jgi:uncharacterized membrane protein